jgi:hypothetical protein
VSSTGAKVVALAEALRRSVKPEPKEFGVLLKGPLVRRFLAGQKTVTRRTDLTRWRKAKPGDLIWFRETHCNIAVEGYSPVYLYRADGDDKPDWMKWTPSLLMKKSAARCWAEIEDIREEKLQDITEQDAAAEGAFFVDDPIHGFRALWDSINGKKPGLSWDDNPTVARVQFRRIER